MFKGGCVIWVAKRSKEDCFIESYIANVVKCKAGLKVKFKCISVTMH